LVGLAKRLEDKPFHLIAAFSQHGTKEWAESYLRSKGLAPSAPNFTVTKGGRHPDVKGNGYVPYYMVFDHTGKLVHRRILDGVKRYRDRRLALVESLLATDPARAVDVLEELADEFEDTKLGAAPAKRLEELEGSRDLKDAKRIARRFASYKKRLERCDSCDACRRGEGLRTIRLSCATCRKENERAVESTKKRLAKLIEGKEHLPVAKTVRAYVEALG